MIERDELLGAFDPVSLDELEDRAALLRRVDNKYALPLSAFEQLAHRLSQDHQVLEIDARRAFRYRTTYFETPDLRCFVDHVEDRVPRFEARTRLYEDTGECVFEVKLKRADDETDKRQIGYSSEDHGRLTDEARECVRSALEGAELAAPDDLGPALTTTFERVTLAATHGTERLTCDFGVRLIGRNDNAATTHHDLVLIETKSEAGDSPADREFGADGTQADLAQEVPGGHERRRRGAALWRPARQRPLQALTAGSLTARAGSRGAARNERSDHGLQIPSG